MSSARNAEELRPNQPAIAPLVDHANLPPIATAPLPATYEHAIDALAQCVEIDECKLWADRAQAMASYARQAADDALLKMSRRIQARAIDRCGELLKQIEPAKGGDRRSEGYQSDGAGSLVTRTQAAREAGLSERQQMTAIRVNNVPREEFEAAVESDDPPTVTALAEQGRKPRATPPPLVDLGERSPEDFAEATKVLGLVTRFVVDSATLDTAAALRGFTAAERTQALDRVDHAIRWLCQFEGACLVQ